MKNNDKVATQEESNAIHEGFKKVMDTYTEEEHKKGIWNSLGLLKGRCPICNELADESPPEENIHAPCCIILDKQREEARQLEYAKNDIDNEWNDEEDDNDSN